MSALTSIGTPFGRRGALAVLALLSLCLFCLACGRTSPFSFPDPKPEFKIENFSKQASGGGTLYLGSARNVGEIKALDTHINITVLGAGGTNLGTYTTTLGRGFDDTTGLVQNDIEMDQIGYFTIVVPVPLNSIASERFTFTFDLPVE